MKLPAVGMPLSTVEQRVENMLVNFREKRQHPHKADLVYATYSFNLTKKYVEFVEIVDEWFRQVKMIFDEQTFFKATSNLCNLGKVNLATEGRLIDRFGWDPIDYFLRRMIEIGFHRFHAEDVVSALSGIHNFLTFSDSNPPPESMTLTINDWLIHFERYLFEKRPNDLDWSVLVRETAPLSLFFLNWIDQSQISHSIDGLTINQSLIDQLFRLTKIGFDEILLEIRRRGNRSDVGFSKIIHGTTAYLFPQFCFRPKIEPESAAPNIFQSWYDLYFLTMKFRSDHSLLDYGFALQMAVNFPSFRSNQFWPRFHLWYDLVEKSLRTFLTETDRRSETWNSYGKIFHFIHVMGLFVKYCRSDDQFKLRKSDFRRLTVLIENILSTTREPIYSSDVHRNKTDKGLKELRKI